MTPTETLVAHIFAEFLGLEFVEAEDDVFSLGGDSMEAVRIALQIERDFDVKLPIDLLEHSGTVRDVAALIDELKADAG